MCIYHAERSRLHNQIKEHRGWNPRGLGRGEKMKIVLGIAVFVLVVFFIISFAFLSAEEFGEE
jgi:hypothetical protein